MEWTRNPTVFRPVSQVCNVVGEGTANFKLMMMLDADRKSERRMTTWLYGGTPDRDIVQFVHMSYGGRMDSMHQAMLTQAVLREVPRQYFVQSEFNRFMQTCTITLLVFIRIVHLG